MMLKKLELHGFKSFAKKTELIFDAPVTSIVGPNGSGKSNVVESIRFVLGEQSIKSLRSASGKDLIFAGSKQIPKMNRASVSITFDNSKRVFQLANSKNETLHLDFDEIVIGREVFADGSNVYKINGQEVRMKDVVELIASVNIGSSGHHIISQGEADRLLNTNTKERKSMIEEALGLKLYQYRIKESEKKLEKTESNLKETESLRRELAPHLKFLKRQVEKIERAKEMRVELEGKYRVYLKQEETLLDQEKVLYQTKKHEFEIDLKKLDDMLVIMKQDLNIDGKTPEEEQLEKLEKELYTVRSGKEDLSRQLGKLEGMIEIASQPQTIEKKPDQVWVDLKDVESLVKDIDVQVGRMAESGDLQVIQQQLQTIRGTLHEFVASRKDSDDQPTLVDNSEKIAELQKTQEIARQQMVEIETQEQGIQGQITELRNALAHEKHDVQKREREYFELASKRSDVQSQLNMLTMKYESTQKALQDFEEELQEAKVLVGEEVMGYQSYVIEEGASFDRVSQEHMRRDIERMKIKIEEIGGGGGADVMREYDETVERDQFLEREIADLEQSIASLKEVMQELKQELEKEFTTGIHKINEQFQNFFALMFGGGKAALKIVAIEKRKKKITDLSTELEAGEEMMEEDDDGSPETGIEIKVNLPRKKISHLEMLSGGERSLTSIALLFALSQVNPPPFLVLDETDAALDEANSRRYGDMIENLSKLSQLMVVTHNRETMSRADILYGVTIGSEGCSQLLSVKFEEAEGFAK